MSTYFSKQGFKAKRKLLKQQIRKINVLNQISINHIGNSLLILGPRFKAINLLSRMFGHAWDSQITPIAKNNMIPCFFQINTQYQQSDYNHSLKNDFINKTVNK